MAGCRGEPELPVRVLADLQPFEMREPRESVKAADRSDPVGREAIDICVPRSDASVDVSLRPEALVGANGHRGAGAYLRQLADGMLADRLLHEVDVVFAQSSQVSYGL